jgi:hypothetical protein
VAALAAVAGCGGPSSLSGAITLDGAPLAGATITLHPSDPGSGAVMVVGATKADGTFVITPAAGKSIARGTYKMTLSKRADPTPAESAAMVVTRETVPEKYSNLTKTELTVTVPTGGDVVLNLTR